MNAKPPGLLRRWWTAWRSPSAKWSVLALTVVGFFAGIIFWGGFHTAMEATNTIQFCTGCHEMHDNVYQEYQGTVHDTNRTGVRAICSDCHVPKDWVHKIARKIQASNEVYHKLVGTVNTKEKFEANRMAMATRVWKTMKDSDSRECRNCHSFEAMNSTKQTPRAQKNHAKARTEGKTCIDCHKGIAHLLPQEYTEDEE
jgi:cytochrome c-type protein NapC